jgi:WD40 repeat protein
VARAREESRRRHRRLAFLAFGALVGLALACALAVFALAQRSDAQDQAEIATSGQLAASALSLVDSDPELGLALALEAARIAPNARAEDALRRTLKASRERAIYDVGHPLVSLDLAPSGSIALVVDAGHVARLIDLRARVERWSRRVDGAAAAFAPDGRTVHVITGRSLLKLDARTGKPLGDPVRLTLPGIVEKLVPSPDGRTGIVIAGKPRARVVDLTTGVAVGRVKQPPRVTDASYASSGRIVGSAGADHSARLWDPRTWTETHALRGHDGQVIVVAVDGASNRVGTGSTDQTARIWRARTGELITPLFGHTGYVEDVAFGPEGLVVTASGDGTARTWTASGDSLEVLRGHSGAVVAAEFAARDVVVTAGADGTIRTWDPGTSVELTPTRLKAPPPPSKRASGPGGVHAEAIKSAIRLRTPDGEKTLQGHADLVNAVDFSPDGRLLVSAGRDHDVIVWDVASGELLYRFAEAQSGSVPDARFSPDGRWIVTAGSVSARLWNVADGRDLMFLYGPKPKVKVVGFQPDSRTIVTREESGVVRSYRCELCGDVDELSALARARLRATGKALTDEDRARFLD